MIRMLAIVLVLSGISTLGHGQFSATGAPVPNLVNFAGTLKDSRGHPIQSVTGVTFSLYAQEEGGVPLWLETQNVQADGKGNYTVQLGATKAEGLPLELFTSSTARWLGVQINGGEEQLRVLLVSVPYALKAADSQTLGGLPASAFMLAAPVAIGSAASGSTTETVPPPAATDVTTTGGTLNYLPIFSGTSTIIDSAVFQTGGGTTAHVGINTTTPASALDVAGGATVRGTFTLAATGNATATAGKNSNAQVYTASAYNSGTAAPVPQKFQWQAEPLGNDTATPSATVNLLFAQGSTTPVETGLKITSRGILNFASGQTFPGTGPGTIKGVTAGTGLSGGGTSGTVTLNNTGLLGLTAGTGIASSGGQTPTLGVDSTQVPFLTTANNFSSTQAVNSDTGTGFQGESGSGYGVYGSSNSNYGVVGLTDSGNGVYGQVTAASQGGVIGRTLDSSGNWAIYAFGNIGASGTKSSVVTVDNGRRQVALYAVESPGVWFEDYGSGQLVSGVATVNIDPAYAQTVNTGVEYHVFLTPDGDCEGLYVTARTATAFEVRELRHGKSNVAFDYRIIALRRGYETKRLADVTNATPRSTIETPRPGHAGSAAGTATAK
jgi:hypothetical protein